MHIYMTKIPKASFGTRHWHVSTFALPINWYRSSGSTCRKWDPNIWIKYMMWETMTRIPNFLLFWMDMHV